MSRRSGGPSGARSRGARGLGPGARGLGGPSTRTPSEPPTRRGGPPTRTIADAAQLDFDILAFQFDRAVGADAQRHRLIGNHKLWFRHECARHGNPLPLPTGKFVGVLGQPFLGRRNVNFPQFLEGDVDGLDLRFGNDETVLEMVHRICLRKGWLGDTLADGGIPAAEKIGDKAFDYLIQVKGMNNLHSDERGTPALALNIATASRGSDHLRSRPAIDLYHLPEPVLRKIYGNPVPYDGPLSSEHTSYDGKAWQVFWQENCYMAVDCLGICKYHTVFLGATLPNFEDWPKVLYLNTGLELTPSDIWTIAERCNMIERLFNLREGLTRNDLKKGDMLNHRYFDEPCRRGAPDVVGRKIDREKFKQMIDEFYMHKGLDENGVPKPETLQRLGLENEPSHLL